MYNLTVTRKKTDKHSADCYITVKFVESKMEYVSNSKMPGKSSMKQRRQSDLKIWEGDEDFQPVNVEADLFEQVTDKLQLGLD